MANKPTFSFVLEPATLAAIRQYARLDGVATGEWVRRAILTQLGTEAAQLERKYVEVRQAIENLHTSYGIAQ
jgi:hypothetical protein